MKKALLGIAGGIAMLAIALLIAFSSTQIIKEIVDGFPAVVEIKIGK